MKPALRAAAALLFSSGAMAQAPSVPEIAVLPGQTLIFSPDAATGAILRPRPSNGATPAAGELSAELKVTDSGSTLTVTNGTDAVYSYKARIYVDDRPPQPTSVCAVMSMGRFEVEHWVDKVRGVELSSFQKMPDEKVACK